MGQHHVECSGRRDRISFSICQRRALLRSLFIPVTVGSGLQAQDCPGSLLDAATPCQTQTVPDAQQSLSQQSGLNHQQSTQTELRMSCHQDTTQVYIDSAGMTSRRDTEMERYPTRFPRIRLQIFRSSLDPPQARRCPYSVGTCLSSRHLRLHLPTRFPSPRYSLIYFHAESRPGGMPRKIADRSAFS